MKSILFDLDGVLIKTERSTFDFYKEEFERQGIKLNEADFQLKLGRKSVDFFNDLEEKYPEIKQIDTKALTIKKRKEFATDVKRYVEFVQDAVQVLTALKAKGYQMVIASQNEREMVDRVLETFNIKQFFKFSLSLQDIQRKKPDPQIYLMCLEMLNIPREEAIVIEDSPDGIGAGKNALLKVIAINTSRKKELLTGADIIINSLSELTPDLAKNAFLS